MERKKILFIHESLAGGGAEKVFVDLMHRFDRTRYHITILLLYGGGTHVQSLPKDIELITLYEHKSILHKVRNHFISTRDSMYRADIRKALNGRKFDTIISYLEGPAMKAHTFVTDLAGKNISWIHVNLKSVHWSSYMFRNAEEEAYLYTKMDDLVFVSKGALTAFDELMQVPVRKHVIPNIIECSQIRSRAKEQEVKTDKFTIINVGRFELQKRHDRLLRVAHLLKEKGLDFKLWLLGTGTLEHKMRQLSHELGLDDIVEFKGFTTNPFPYMKAADMFLLTSDTEGWPTVVCESLCLGLPVLSTRITGSEELLDGGVGVLTSLDESDIADKVYDIATNPTMLGSYAERSKKRGEEFNPEAVMAKIYSLI